MPPHSDSHPNLDNQREKPEQSNDFLKHLKLEAKRKAHEKVKGIAKYRNTDRSDPIYRKRMDARISQENQKFYKDLLEQDSVEQRKENEWLRLQVEQGDITLESQFQEYQMVLQRNVQLQLENESLKAGRTVLPSALSDVISSLYVPCPSPSDALSSGSTYATDGLSFQITNVSPVEETSPIQVTDNMGPNLTVAPMTRKVRISVEVEVPQSVPLNHDPKNIPSYLLPGAQFQQEEANNDNLNLDNGQP